MNTKSGLSFYDSLNKLTVGWLIIMPILADTGSAFNNPIAHVAAFLVGIIYQCVIQRSTNCLRNCICLIRKQNKWVKEERRRKRITKNQYNEAYYKVAMAGVLTNIPVLEAIENFIRNIFFIAVIYIIALASKCPNFCSIIEGIGSPGCCATVLTVIVLLLMLTWYYVQNKIFELVWEGEHYIEIINKKRYNETNSTNDNLDNSQS